MPCPYNSAGTMSFARPWIAASTTWVFGVGSRLTSATKAPASLASEAKDAAGYTIPDVPTMSSTSHERTAEKLRSRSTGSSDSPNQTMCGRSSPLHVGQLGGMVIGTARFVPTCPHWVHLTFQMFPWISESFW